MNKLSFYPDYRKQALRKLDADDREFLMGYRHCMEDAVDYFECMDISDYDEEEEAEEAAEAFEIWMSENEMMLICALFDDPKYEDIDLEDESDDEDDFDDDYDDAYYPYRCDY